MYQKSQIAHIIYSSKRFIYFVIKHFIDDDCTYRASALAFTTLLAIVPLMSVGFAVLSSFPVFHDLQGPVQDFIFENFVPATGKVVQDYLKQFALQATKLSIIGLAFLFMTAVLVMFTIERSMNQIWRIQQSRNGVSAFLLYWAILSLAPLLLGLSLAISSFIFSSPLVQHFHGPSFIVRLIPFMLSLVGFTFLFVLVPNCRVRIAHGLAGALVSALLFELAKKGFAYYLSQYNTYQLLYGALATIPIFFIWVYWVWLITLIGTEISYALAVHHKRRQGKALDGLTHALLWLHSLWQAQLDGKGLKQEALIAASNRPFEIASEEMLRQLEALNLIQRSENGDYLLSCNLAELTLYDLVEMLPYPLPEAGTLAHKQSPIAKRWHTQIEQAEKQLKETLQIDLNQLFQ